MTDLDQLILVKRIEIAIDNLDCVFNFLDDKGMNELEDIHLMMMELETLKNKLIKE